MKHPPVWAAVTVLLCGCAAMVAAQGDVLDYTQWRGRDRDDAGLIVARSSRTGFEPLKRYTVADSATWAQPAISGNRLFIKDVTSLALWTLQ